MSVGNRPDGLLVPETRYCAAIDNLEDGSFGLHGGVGRLVENAPHVAVALRRPVAVVQVIFMRFRGRAARLEINPVGESRTDRTIQWLS